MSLDNTQPPSAKRRKIDAAERARQGILNKKSRQFSQIQNARAARNPSNVKLNVARNSLANKRDLKQNVIDSRKQGRSKQNKDRQILNNKNARNVLQNCDDLEWLFERIEVKLNELAQNNEICTATMYVCTHHVVSNIMYNQSYLCVQI